MIKNFLQLESSGFGLMEAIAGVSVIGIFMVSVMLSIQLSQKTVNESVRNSQAAFLLEEGFEAIKIIRDTSWTLGISSLSTGTNHYLGFNGTSWVSTSTNAYIDGIFERKFALANVYRDANDDIAASGMLDAGTKKATVYISWLGRTGTTTRSASIYLTNMFSN